MVEPSVRIAKTNYIIHSSMEATVHQATNTNMPRFVSVSMTHYNNDLDTRAKYITDSVTTVYKL